MGKDDFMRIFQPLFLIPAPLSLLCPLAAQSASQDQLRDGEPLSSVNV